MTEISPDMSVALGVRQWRVAEWNYARAYIYIVVPILFALCFLTGPFRVADEPAHFFRAIQLSHGHAEPVLGSAGNSAGGMVETSAIGLVAKTGTIFIEQTPVRRVVPRDVVVEWKAEHAGGPLTFVAFNNTVIYFPIAHAIPAVTIAMLRLVGAPPLAWLYIARLTNALTAVVISTAAIALFEESGLFAMVLCSLPMVLFEEASLSADALVIPFSVLLAALVARIARKAALGWGFYTMLFIALLYVSVGKLAYIPLVLLPPAVAIIQKRNRSAILVLTAISLLVLAIWTSWSLLIHNEVFTIDAHTGIVDVHRQLDGVLRHPLLFPSVIFRTLDNIRAQRRLIEETVGSNLGWLHVSTPKILVALFLSTLAAAATFRQPIAPMRAASRVLTLVLLVVSFLAIYLLLYLQYTPLGQSTVLGVQGRYMLPLMAFLPLVVPGWSISEISVHRLSTLLLLTSGFAGLATLVVVWSACWGHP